MYRKKIAVRAMTAIAAGALLASNVMVAGATAGTVKPVEQTLTAESAIETEAEEGEDSSEESAGNQEEEEKDNIPESEAEDAETEESTEAVADETEESAEEEKASTEEAETEAETDNQANVLRAPAANVMAVDETQAEENRTATLNVYLKDLDNKEPLNEGKPVVIEKEVKEGEELADFTMEDLKAEAGSLLDGYEIDKAYVEAGLPSVGADSSRDVEVGVRHQEEGLTTQIAHVQFVYNNEVIAGGDYFVMADKDGVFNYEELKQYVPEGYTFTVTGDASVKTPKIVVELTKLEEELTSQIAHVQFVYNDEVIAGGDYFVMADKDGVFNYEELKQYVPEGYTFTVTGDENVKTPQIVVELTKVEEGLTAQIAHVQFVYGDEVVAGGDYFVMADKDGVFKYEELKQYVPEGYTFTITGDASVKTPVIVVELTKNEEPTPEPEQKVTSTVTINFVYNGATMATQTFDKTGLKNDTFKVSNSVVDMTKVPSGYEIASKFEEKEYHYGENVTLTVELKRQSSNNGGGSSSGGSSGGGGTRTAAAFGSSGTLANGNWHQLDDQRWEYNYTDGTKARNGWYTLIWQDRMDWYYFDADGYLVSGWYTDANGVKYYLHAQHDGTFGRMYTGWNKVDGTWQHFNDNTEQGVYGAWEEGTPVPAELANL